MKIEEVNINDLKPYARNQKIHTQKQVQMVANSIQKFGIIQPIVINKNNIIVSGHCRYEAGKLLRLKTFPCVRKEDLTDKEEKELRILDNKLNESEWDNEMLELEIRDYGLDLEDFEIKINLEPLELEKASVDKYQVIVYLENAEEQENFYNQITKDGFVASKR